ncbi:M48 family metallopeptidase [Pseudoroseomonas cervicalis]|uniref:M48 family metallopeptidase n=1 Tax=Teichococcus cervicalis TaxID=204525 RepID=UPI00277FE6D9|nr:SprT family zinc-dependent metalloprotease [Pseudoroseomonas cervicalis]MDQ1080409.1 putative metal-dependent hydrolase [Pseudoroseomonas cervicalis]
MAAPDQPDPPLPEALLLRPAPGAAAISCALLWRRSARARLVSLRIEPVAGAVLVTLPASLTPAAGRRAGLALLRRHAAWVTARLAALAPPLRLRPGAAVPLGDVPHPIRHDPGHAGPAALRPGGILVGGGPDTLPAQVMALLQDEAGRRIRPLVRRHAARLGVAPRAVRLKDPRGRWGSCAPDGTLAFSWRLVMAPPWVLDYVVAHEVAHLEELNHSPRFWAVLAALNPHHAAAQAWLRRHGPGLLRVG